MTADSGGVVTSPRSVGVWVLGIATALGLIDTIFNYFWTGNGIHGSAGAGLVVIATALQLIATLLIYFGVLRGRWRTLFEVLICLDLIGTAIAAFFLEAWILLVLTIIAAIGWLMHVIRRPASNTSEVNP